MQYGRGCAVTGMEINDFSYNIRLSIKQLENLMSHSEFQSYIILKSKTLLACFGISGLKRNRLSKKMENKRRQKAVKLKLFTLDCKSLLILIKYLYFQPTCVKNLEKLN